VLEIVKRKAIGASVLSGLASAGGAEPLGDQERKPLPLVWEVSACALLA